MDGQNAAAEPFIYFDGAHNADGIAHFVKNVQKIAGRKASSSFFHDGREES